MEEGSRLSPPLLLEEMVEGWETSDQSPLPRRSSTAERSPRKGTDHRGLESKAVSETAPWSDYSVVVNSDGHWFPTH